MAEKYFNMYHVSRDTWASFATMHFTGNAALWLQTFEAEHEIDGWEELVVAVHAKFGKDKHHRYLEALERCRQTDSVEKYYHKFEELRHKVLIHNRHYDEAFFVTKFVGAMICNLCAGDGTSSLSPLTTKTIVEVSENNIYDVACFIQVRLT